MGSSRMLCPACPVIGRPTDAAESTRYNRGLPSRLSTDVIDRTAGFPMRPDRDVRLRLRDLNAARWTRQLLPKSGGRLARSGAMIRVCAWGPGT